MREVTFHLKERIFAWTHAGFHQLILAVDRYWLEGGREIQASGVLWPQKEYGPSVVLGDWRRRKEEERSEWSWFLRRQCGTGSENWRNGNLPSDQPVQLSTDIFFEFIILICIKLSISILRNREMQPWMSIWRRVLTHVQNLIFQERDKILLSSTHSW